MIWLLLCALTPSEMIPKSIVLPPPTVQYSVFGLPTNKPTFFAVTWLYANWNGAKEIESPFSPQAVSTNQDVLLEWNNTSDTNVINAYVYYGSAQWTFTEKQIVFAPEKTNFIYEGHMQWTTNGVNYFDQTNSTFFKATNVLGADKMLWRGVFTKTPF